MALELHNPKWKSPPLKESLKNDIVFGLLPEKILTVIEEKLIQFNTFDANEIIQTNFSIAKYIYFIRRGGCTVELINGSQIYKESLKVDDIYGVESMASSTYRSNVTANTLMVVVGLKKNHVEKIMDYFFDFEEAFWKKHVYTMLKMLTTNRDLVYFMTNHLSKEHVDDLITHCFSLKRAEPSEFRVEQDTIFLRGHVEVYNEEEERYMRLPPMAIVLSSEGETIRVVEKSSLLVGELPISKLESEMYTPNSIRKKNSKILMESTPSKLKTSMRKS